MKGLDAYCDYLEGLTRKSVSNLTRHVAPDVHFKDPFNDVRGADAMRLIFDDMFEQLITPDMFDNLETYFAVELAKLLKELKLAEDVEVAHLGTSSKDIVQKMKLQVEAPMATPPQPSPRQGEV